MKTYQVQRTKLLIIFTLLLIVATAVVGQGRTVSAETRGELLTQLNAATDGNLYTSESQFGTLTMLRSIDDHVLSVDNNRAATETRARDFIAEHGTLFGIDNAYAELTVNRIETDDLGVTRVRFDQMHNGVPVFGAQMIVHLTDAGVKAANGVFVPDIAVAEAGISLESAEQIAVQDVAKRDPNAHFTIFETDELIYHTGLLRGVEGDTRLVYSIKTASDGPVEQILIDATDGVILNTIPLRHGAKYRRVYTPLFGTVEVGNEDSPPPPIITLDDPLNPGTTLFVGAPVSSLFDFAGQVYDFFDAGFSFDSWDGQGADMHSVYLINQNCPNAYWNGISTNYCPGFDLDDVVAHEWGHAYTEKTHGLIYQWQAGALNEAYSDMWGETVDLFNDVDDAAPGFTNDNTQPYPDGVRWVVGEGLSDPVVTLLLRDMWNPERLGYAATVTSDNYHCATSDNGGVHYNSSVPNLAYAMLADGREFNGYNIEKIGFIKASEIYFHASINYQVPTTNFSQHADALEASCTDLLGATPENAWLELSSNWVGVENKTITQHDCDQITKAMAAVEMRVEPAQCNFQPMLAKETPALCGEGLSANSFYAEDWESGMDGWTLHTEPADASGTGAGDAWPDYNWEIKTDLPGDRAGNAIFAIDDRSAGTCTPGAGDVSGRFWIDSPVMTIHAGDDATIAATFNHWVATETDFDGGNLLVKVNDGDFTIVDQANYVFNAPPATLDSAADGNTNPKAGEVVWAGTDGGEVGGTWGTTIVDLAGIGATTGDTVQLRWDFGIDGCNGVTGWYVDEVNAYTCTAGVPTAVNLSESGSTENTSLTWLLVAIFATLTTSLFIWQKRA